MRQLLLGMAAVAALTFGVSTSVDARGPSGHGSHGSSGGHGNFRSFPSQHQHQMRPNTTRTFNQHNNHFHNNQYHNAHMRYGTRFNHGYYFRSRPGYWGGRQWNRQYSCWTYWCPSSSCYYYWCAPYQCYYPVSYCPTGSYAYAEPAYAGPVAPPVQYGAPQGPAVPYGAPQGPAMPYSGPQGPGY